MKFGFSTLLIFISCLAFSQAKSAPSDSLLIALDNADTQKEKIEITFQLIDSHDKIDEKLVYGKYALELSEDTRNKKYLAQSYEKMSIIYKLSNEPIEAINWKIKAITQWNNTGYKIELAKSHFGLGDLYDEIGSASDAQVSFENSLEIYQNENNFQGIAKVKNRLGILHKNLNDLTTALELYFEALQVEEEKGLPMLEAKTLLNIGVIYKLKDEHVLALKFYQKAIEKFKNINSPIGIAKTSNNLGNIYRKQGNNEQALTYYNRALDIFEELDNRSLMSMAYNNIGLVHRNKGKFELALTSFNKSLEIKLEENMIYGVPMTYSNLATVYGDLGQVKKAKAYFEKGFLMAKKYNIEDELAQLYNEMASFEESQGNSKEALRLYKQYLSYEDSIIKSENNKRMIELQTIYALSEIEKKNEILELENKKVTSEKKTKELEQGQLKIVIYFLIAFVLLGGLLLANYYRKLRYIKKITSDLENTNQELQETLISKEEKELLLKEIHHRVKNNLQVINSLLRLQSSKVDDEKIEELFKECEARVKSMALVHEELYKTDNLSSVNIREYVDKLGNDLMQAYALDKEIKFISRVDINFMGIDTLLPLGLMINEIISNSLKHAFTDGNIENPEIYIEIQFTDLKEYEMRLGDNGRGIPSTVNFDMPDSLGLELVQTLTEQLEGELTLDKSKPGTHFIVLFKNLDIKGIIHS
jgi:two-component sensor histidine kinase/Tfp pilus assembly protein PilF